MFEITIISKRSESYYVYRETPALPDIYFSQKNLGRFIKYLTRLIELRSNV